MRRLRWWLEENGPFFLAILAVHTLIFGGVYLLWNAMEDRLSTDAIWGVVLVTAGPSLYVWGRDLWKAWKDSRRWDTVLHAVVVVWWVFLLVNAVFQLWG